MRPAITEEKSAWLSWPLPLAAIALWCASAVALSLAHGLECGSDAAIGFLSIMAVFFTALCALRLERRSAADVRILAGLLVAIGVTYNLTNAIGLVAGYSDQKRSSALTQQGIRQSLQADLASVEAQVAALDGALGSASIASLSAEIAELERNTIFDRTKRCTEATLNDSRAHCAKWDKAKQLLESAKRRKALQDKLETINAQLRAAPVRESADPKAEAIARVLAFIGLSVRADDVRYAVIVLPAVIAELMAAFGAAMCGVRLPSQGHTEATEMNTDTMPTAGKARSKRGGKKKQLSSKELIERFLAAHIKLASSDSAVRSSELYTAFQSWWVCHAPGRRVPSQIALGQAMSAKGFTRSKRGGVSRYDNVKLVPIGTA